MAPVSFVPAFHADRLERQRATTNPLEAPTAGGVAAIAVTLEVRGQPGVEGRVAALDELPGVVEVTTTQLGRDAD